MKKLVYLFACTMIISLLSCSEKKEEKVYIYHGSIDDGEWINCHTIGTYYGYTGDHCSKVDSVNQYSFGLAKLLSEISSEPVKRIKVSVWVKLMDLSKIASLVVSISGPDGKSLFYSGHDLNPNVKEANKWFKVDFEDTIPDIETNGSKVGIYVWNNNKNVVYIDDYDIRFFSE
jgi:hypothetical protein